jgi:hypothetical protein
MRFLDLGTGSVGGLFLTPKDLSVALRPSRAPVGALFLVSRLAFPAGGRGGDSCGLGFAVLIKFGNTYECSQILLVRVHLEGTLELLTAAWERVVG